MNKAVIAMGVIILLFSLYPIFYTATIPLPYNGVSCNAPGDTYSNNGIYGPTCTQPVMIYLYEGAIVALIGVVTLVIGFAIPRVSLGNTEKNVAST